MKGRNKIGTNYYWFEKERKKNQLTEEGLHIGKDSCGWVFNFQVHNSLNLTAVEAYKEFTKKGYIYNEYDELIPYNDFWKIVEDSKLPWNDGKVPYSYDSPNVDRMFDVEEYMNEGYMFTNCDFS